LALVVIFTWFIWWMGVFKKIQITETTFYGGTFIYKDYQGHIKNVRKAFGLIVADLDAWKRQQVRQITLPCTGVYYDDPHNLKDPEKCRASVGFLVPFRSEQAVEHFKKLSYKQKQLPQVQAVHGAFPYRMPLSFTLGSVKYYPSCLRFVAENADKYGAVFDF